MKEKKEVPPLEMNRSPEWIQEKARQEAAFESIAAGKPTVGLAGQKVEVAFSQSFRLDGKWFKTYDKEGDDRPQISNHFNSLEKLLDQDAVKARRAESYIGITRGIDIRVKLTPEQLYDIGVELENENGWHPFQSMTQNWIRKESVHVPATQDVPAFKMLQEVEFNSDVTYKFDVMDWEFFLHIGNNCNQPLPGELGVTHRSIRKLQNMKDFLAQKGIEKLWKDCYRSRKAMLLFAAHLQPALMLRIRHREFGQFEVSDEMWDIPGEQKWEEEVLLEDNPTKFKAVELDRIPTKEQALEYFQVENDMFGKRLFPVIVCPIPEEETREWKDMIISLCNIPKAASVPVTGTYEGKPAKFIGTRCKEWEFPEVIETAYAGGAFAITRCWDW